MRIPFVEEGAAKPDTSKYPALSVAGNDKSVTVGNKNFKVEFIAVTGLPQYLEYNGKQVIKGNFRPNLWHARIDNDPKTKNNESIFQLAQEAFRGKSFKSEGLKIEKVSGDLAEGTSRVVVQNDKADISFNIKWKIHSSGLIHAEVDFKKKRGPESLPRIGFIFEAPEELNNWAWFGRGPHESYNDRKTGAAVGIYRLNVGDMCEDYELPQETGNRDDVRWAMLTGKSIDLLLCNGILHFFFLKR